MMMLFLISITVLSVAVVRLKVEFSSVSNSSTVSRLSKEGIHKKKYCFFQYKI